MNIKKKEIITISGFPGSGKSSTGDLLAKKLKFKRFSSGDFMRKIALRKKITLNELSIQAEKDLSIDMSIDDEVKKAGKKNKLIIDSRLAFHWIPNSFKVYLTLPPQIAKDRIFENLKTNELRKKSEGNSKPEDIYKKIIHRLESEKKRYMKMYKVDHTHKKNFDLVIDTSKHNLNEVVSIIVSEYKNWLKS